MEDKYKDKIKKLLELSLSENKNETSIASRQAMALMNRHNVTKEEVYGQKMISKIIATPYTRPPAWYLSLYSSISKLSGCLAVYSNGRADIGKKSRIEIAGRERDVKNAIYLIVFLARELEQGVINFKKTLSNNHYPHKTQLVKSYRIGFISKIYSRMQASRNQFFTDHNNHNQLICIDNETRRCEAREYYVRTHDDKLRTKKSNTTQYYADGVNAGASAADKLQINNAVHRQNQILGIDHQ